MENRVKTRLDVVNQMKSLNKFLMTLQPIRYAIKVQVEDPRTHTTLLFFDKILRRCRLHP